MRSGFTCKVIDRTDVPKNSRSSLGKYARLYDELCELPPAHSFAIEVASKLEGYYITQELRRIAKAEGLVLGWSRNRLHTEFFYWLDRPKPLQVRRPA